MRFLHAADLHLDSPLIGLERYEGAPVDVIRGATRRALENLVNLAQSERVDFVLIAGDLYDGDWRDFNTGMFFTRQMGRLSDAGIPVYLIAGNHDAANVMTRKLRLPVNPDGFSMMLSHEQAETRRLDDLGVAIHGRSFSNQAETANMVPGYPAAIGQWFNIGLLHTSLSGSDEHDTYAPCTTDDLRLKSYQYWALGHIHKPSIVNGNEISHGTAPTLYSGNLQGRHVRECGPRGCFLIDVDSAHRMQVTFRSLDVFRWEICAVDCRYEKSLDGLLERFGQELQTVINRSNGLPMGIRVIFEGATSAHQELCSAQDAVTAEIRSAAAIASDGRVWVERVKIATKYLATKSVDYSGDGPLAELEHYLDHLPDDLLALKQLGEDLKDLARKLPAEIMQPPDGLQVDQVSWLREVARDLKPIILQRLKG